MSIGPARLASFLAALALPACSLTDLQSTRADRESAPCPARAEVRSFVGGFLARRVAGSGAERFLTPRAAREFNPAWGRTGVGLHPLYARGPRSYSTYRVLFVEPLASRRCWYEVGYVLGAPSSQFTETLFVLGRPSGLRITGGRLGLTGP